MDVWASPAIVGIETIHAVVKPYAEGGGGRKCQGMPRKQECGMLLFSSGERPSATDERNEKKWVIYL